MPFISGTVSTFANQQDGSPGLLQKLKEFVFTSQFSQNAAAGNGILTNFAGTLENGPIAKGQCRISYIIGSFAYAIYENGEGTWIADNIVSSALDYVTRIWSITFSAPLDAGTSLQFLFAVGPEGRDWLIISNQNTKNLAGTDAFPGLPLQELVIKNSGVTYKENIYCGFREAQYPTLNYYSIDLNIYRSYSGNNAWIQNAAGTMGHGLSIYDTTRNSFTALPRLGINNDTINYWFYVSKNAIIVIAKVTGTRYVSLFTGFILRFSPPSDYPNPLFLIGSHAGAADYTDNATASFLARPLSSAANRHVLGIDPDNIFIGYSLPGTHNPVVLPGYDTTWQANPITHTALNEISLYPCLISDTGTSYLLGQMEKVYFCPSDLVRSEDVILHDTKQYRVFQDIHRISYQDFMCIEES